MAQVRVRLQTARVQLIFEGDESVFERQIEPLLLGLARGQAGAARPASTPPPEAPPPAQREGDPEGGPEAWRPAVTSFRTFQRQLADEPEDPGGRIAAYAFYLWNYEKRETFGAEELEGCFAAGGDDVPADLVGSCAALERQRILQPAAHEGTWRLTPKGTNKVRKLLR